MKKLMCAVAAVAAGVAFAGEAPAVQSANIVGYGQVNTDEYVSPSVGSVFFPLVMNDDKTYDLRTVTVSGPDTDTFMEPASECVKVLNPENAGVSARYSYLSKEWLICNFDDAWESKKWAIGWWKHVKDHDYYGDVENDEDPDNLQIKEAIELPIGTALLGNFDGNELHFISSGEVVQDTTDFATDGNVSPYFLNYLPVDIDFSDVIVTGEDDDTFMEPASECVKLLNPANAGVSARYSYLSKEWLICNFDDEWESHAWAIGWWKHVKDHDYYGDVENDKDPDNLQVKDDLPWTSGFGVLGNFDGNKLFFNFPPATDVPSLKK